MKLSTLPFLFALAATVSSAPTSLPESTTPSQLSDVISVVAAGWAPLEVTVKSFVDNANGTHVTLLGTGDASKHKGPGSVASGVGASGGSGYNTASANAASAAAITHPGATNVRLNSTSYANSTTYEGPKGPVTMSFAASFSTAQDDEGDYAYYWAYVTTVSSADGNFTHGNHGGSHKGQATGIAQFGRAPATAAAGGASATIGASNFGPPFTSPVNEPFSGLKQYTRTSNVETDNAVGPATLAMAGFENAPHLDGGFTAAAGTGTAGRASAELAVTPNTMKGLLVSGGSVTPLG